ncbi:MAG TPA: DUF2269 family protein [Terriglobales bacterium]|nr:DUF2269 family protein [Terriglobales bacterium]
MSAKGQEKTRVFPRGVRQTILTIHIVVSVGLLGDTAGFLAVAFRLSRTTEPRAINELVQVLNTFAMVFGIPLSFAAIVTGLILGVMSKWGVFRYPWVVAKQLLIISVMVAGGFVIGPALDTMRHGGQGATHLMAAAAYDLAALTTATALSVFKPGRRFRSDKEHV